MRRAVADFAVLVITRACRLSRHATLAEREIDLQIRAVAETHI